jgi:hypothetical protein
MRELAAQIDRLCEQDPQAALALAQRIQRKLQPGFPWPLTRLHQQLVQGSLEGEELREGMGFGGLHIEDVTEIVERLFYQGAGKFALEVEFENPDDDHLSLTILSIGKAWWQEEGA